MNNYRPPIFVLGNRRSGTTMLRLMLTCHPHIAIPPEGGFIVQLGWSYGHYSALSRYDIIKFVDDLFELGNTPDWNFDKNTLLRSLQGLAPCSFPVLINGVYQEYISRNFSKKNRWGDKTTGIGMVDYLPLINQFFPSSQFLHIVRDGRAVFSSYKRVPHLSSNASQVAMEWRWNIERIRRFGKFVGPDRYSEIKYETLVQEPEKILRRVCEFLQEPFSNQMIDFAQQNRQLELEPKRHLGWKALTLQDVTTSQISKWQNELTSEEVADFEAITGELIDDLEYSIFQTKLPFKQRMRLKGKLLGYWIIRTTKRKLRPWKYRYRLL